jgi:hypothetical protein
MNLSCHIWASILQAALADAASWFLGLGDESFPCFVWLGCLVSATSERRDLMIWEASLGWPRGFLLSLGLAFGLGLVDGKRL